jgi:hypothetical protein
MRLIITFCLSVTLFIFTSSIIFSHSGRTNSSGCHNCNVGSCAGTYHCHGGGSGGGNTYGFTSPVNPIPKYRIPANTNAIFRYFINPAGGYDFMIDWDRPDNKQYSVAMTKSAGGDPGPISDSYTSEYTFRNVKAGRWYVNLKEEINGYWSEVSYWAIDVPENIAAEAIPYPSPTPRAKPLPVVKTDTQTANSDTEDDFWMLLLLGGGGLYGVKKIWDWIWR